VPAVWATPAEVLAVTGITRDAATVAVASSMVATYTGAYPDTPVDAVNARDTIALARATAWQAAWLTPARLASILTEREGSESVSADGVRVQRRTAAEDMLAPMAIREIKNLSWVSTSTQIVPPVSIRERMWDQINFLNERSDGLV
jgi:hypothetical protein